MKIDNWKEICIKELNEMGYTDSEKRVDNYDMYYYDKDDTLDDMLFVMENLKECTQCGDYLAREDLTERGAEEIYCEDCLRDFH